MSQVELKESFIGQISKQLNLKAKQVTAVLNLLDEGNTIPFIARYRKEVTDSLDEVQIYEIDKEYRYAVNLAQRKEEVTRTISDQGKLSQELAEQLKQAQSLQQVEDLYRPYKQKRRTKATIAIENGLEPLAQWLLETKAPDLSLAQKAEGFINEAVADLDAVQAGVHEIIAQYVSDNAEFREFIRKYTRYNGMWVTTLKDESLDERGVYEMYYDFKEKLINLPEHRILATNRAEKEGVITVKIQIDDEPAIQYMIKRFIDQEYNQEQTTLIEAAIRDAYKRFIAPAIEREIRSEWSEKADKHAIQIFGENLRNLLLQPPLKGKVVLGFDPAYRTGCKLAVITPTGQVVDKGVIYPHPPASAKQRAQAGPQLLEMIKKHQIDVIAIGNGTASRESEQFVAELVKELEQTVQFIVVNEAGASVYSASEIARNEFPDFQVEERSAVSIARRLQDPLAELIKIDPKSMGVGQYQHDVSQNMLNEELDFVVNMTVNQVGVDINTASIQLLNHVSGMTATTAKNVIAMRNEIGRFKNRKEIKEVKRLGPKTYEQAVGFLRIMNGENAFDQTSIHPESYAIAEKILSDLELDKNELGSDQATAKLQAVSAADIAKNYGVGEATAEDILLGLMNPRHDIRDGQDAPILRDDVMTMEDLAEGMQLQGVIRNVVDFGAFVDIGVKEDGLIHISQLLKKRGQFIKHPSDVVAVGDIVEVEVISLDKKRSRIGLKQLQKETGNNN